MNSESRQQRIGRIAWITTYIVTSVAVGYWALWKLLMDEWIVVPFLAAIVVIVGYSILAVFLRRKYGTTHPIDDKSTTTPVPPSS